MAVKRNARVSWFPSSRTEGSNPSPSSEESANHQFLSGGAYGHAGPSCDPRLSRRRGCRPRRQPSNMHGQAIGGMVQELGGATIYSTRASFLSNPPP